MIVACRTVTLRAFKIAIGGLWSWEVKPKGARYFIFQGKQWVRREEGWYDSESAALIAGRNWAEGNWFRVREN